jgi:Mg2+ and Co2+ transporter CorA
MVRGKSKNLSQSKRLHHRIKEKLSNIKKRHIRTSIAIVGVIFLSVLTMLIVYRGYNFEINWFSIVIVSLILGFVLGAIEYLYIVRVKGY